MRCCLNDATASSSSSAAWAQRPHPGVCRLRHEWRQSLPRRVVGRRPSAYNYLVSARGQTRADRGRRVVAGRSRAVDLASRKPVAGPSPSCTFTSASTWAGASFFCPSALAAAPLRQPAQDRPGPLPDPDRPRPSGSIVPFSMATAAWPRRPDSRHHALDRRPDHTRFLRSRRSANRRGITRFIKPLPPNPDRLAPTTNSGTAAAPAVRLGGQQGRLWFHTLRRAPAAVPPPCAGRLRPNHRACLTEKPHRRIPRAVLAVGHPVANRAHGEGDPDAPAPRQVSAQRRIRSDHQVELVAMAAVSRSARGRRLTAQRSATAWPGHGADPGRARPAS